MRRRSANLEIAPEVIQELAHGAQRLVSSELEGNGLEDLGSERVVLDLFEFGVGGVVLQRDLLVR